MDFVALFGGQLKNNQQFQKRFSPFCTRKREQENKVYVDSYNSECLSFSVFYISEKY